MNSGNGTTKRIIGIVIIIWMKIELQISYNGTTK